MLTGVRPAIHKLTNVTDKLFNYNNPEFPTFFKLVRNEHPKAELGAYCNWTPLSKGIIEKNLNVNIYADSDDKLTEEISKYIKKSKPELLFIQFDSVDHASHFTGYSSLKYLRAYEIVDTYISKVYKSIEEPGILDDTLLMIISDHGGIGHDHNYDTLSEKYVFFRAIGKTINKNDNIDIECRDMAAIVTYALGGEPKMRIIYPPKFFY